MPRYATFLKFPDGGAAVIHTSKPAHACDLCRAKLSAYQCDYPVGDGRICDKHLCNDCRVPVGKDDYCKTHVRT